MSGKKKRVPRRRPRVSTAGSPVTKGTRSRRCWSWTPARLQGDARRRCGGAARRLRPGGRAHRKTRPDAEPHREGARREARRPAGLVKAKRNRRTDRPAESGKRCQTEGGEWPPDLSNTYPPFLQLGKRHPRGPWGPRGRSVSRRYGLSAQRVRLRSEINHEWCTRHREPHNKPRPRFQS